MPFSSVSVLRKRFPALCLVALLHLVAIGFLLQAIPTTYAPVAGETETKISLLLTPAPAPKKRIRRPAAGTNAITPTFDPDSFRPSMLPQPGVQGLSLALAACAPEKYDMASDEIRAACNRIGMIVAADPGHFGVNTGIANARRRQIEERHRPLLAPCMSPNGPDVLYTLYCIYDQLWNGYDSDKMQHYSK